MPAHFRTAFQGYSIKFSPFEDGKLAVATSQNFGIIGNGKQYVLQVRVDARCKLHVKPRPVP
jgi:peroxin-7